jgi:hypothetical protein
MKGLISLTAIYLLYKSIFHAKFCFFLILNRRSNFIFTPLPMMAFAGFEGGNDEIWLQSTPPHYRDFGRSVPFCAAGFDLPFMKGSGDLFELILGH